mgnify:CR=1 FL=1
MTYKGKAIIRMAGRICGRERSGYIIAEFADHTEQKFDVYRAAFTEADGGWLIVPTDGGFKESIYIKGKANGQRDHSDREPAFRFRRAAS